jgi:phage head maturation protease
MKTRARKQSQRKLPDPGQTLFRDATFEREAIDEKSRKVAVSFSSETDTIRFFGTPQILLHEKGAVDLSRLNSVLLNHNPDHVLGRAEEVKLDLKERKGRAAIVFDDDEESQRIFKKVQGGSIRGVSVGFRVDRWQMLDEGDSWTSPDGRTFQGPKDIATSWRASEFSVTPIPADSTVGVGRTTGQEEPMTQEYDTMDPKLRAALEKRGLPQEATEEEAQAFMLRMAEEPEADKCKGGKKGKGKGRIEDAEGRSEDEGDDPGAAIPIKAREEAPEKSEAELRAERRERERARDVRNACNAFPETRSLAAQAEDEGWSIEQTRKACLEELAKQRPVLHAEHRVEFGEDERDKVNRAAENWLLLRTSRRALVPEKEVIAARDVEAVTLLDLARFCCRRGGIITKGLTVDGLIAAAIGGISTRAFSHGTSDFPLITANVANKALQKAYEESPATWKPLVRTATAGDFKVVTRDRLGDSGSLVETPPLAPMAEGSFAENAESYAILTYTKRFGISRQAIINDDLSAFDRIPGLMGAAARRLIADLFYTLLGSQSGEGPAMVEGTKNLFSTTHASGANYTAGVLALDIAGLGTAKKLMRLQKGMVATDETAPVLNITPNYLVVPAALEVSAEQVTTQITPALVASVPPAWIRSLNVIVEPRLDALTNGTTAWYLVAAPSQIEGAEVAFLNGKEEPTMIRVEGTNILGIEWGVYLDVGCKFLEHRGWYRTKGA